jgi:hypothetical protein
MAAAPAKTHTTARTANTPNPMYMSRRVSLCGAAEIRSGGLPPPKPTPDLPFCPSVSGRVGARWGMQRAAAEWQDQRGSQLTLDPACRR